MPNKYCPECGGEYQEWAVKCIDCGVPLVDEKPNLKKKPADEKEIVARSGQKYVKEPLVAMGSFATTLEAQLSQGILESEGIPSMITTDDKLIAYQPDTSSVGNIHLIVKTSDAEKAKEILDSIIKDIPEGEFPEDAFGDELPSDDAPPEDDEEQEPD
jgi:hypothetical protein